MGATQSEQAMCKRVCINAKRDTTEIAFANANDSSPSGPSRQARMSKRLSNTSEMKQLAHRNAAFNLAFAVPFGAAKSTISETFFEWMESAVWLLYEAVPEEGEVQVQDEEGCQIPPELQCPNAAKEIVDELLSLEKNLREQRLRQWLVPKSEEKASTSTNISRRLSIDDFAPDAVIRLAQYEQLLHIFDDSSSHQIGQIDQLRNCMVHPSQIVGCVEITELLESTDQLSFVSFVISLATKLKSLLECQGMRITLVYENEDLMWNVYDDDRVRELEKISTSGHAKAIQTGTPVLTQNALVVPGKWDEDENTTGTSSSCQCCVLFACFNKGDSDDDSSEEGEDDFSLLDLHFLQVFMDAARPKLSAGRTAANFEEKDLEEIENRPRSRTASRIVPTKLLELLEEDDQEAKSNNDSSSSEESESIHSDRPFSPLHSSTVFHRG